MEVNIEQEKEEQGLVMVICSFSLLARTTRLKAVAKDEPDSRRKSVQKMELTTERGLLSLTAGESRQSMRGSSALLLWSGTVRHVYTLVSVGY